MEDTIENVAKRLTNLEVTVARGFHDAELRDSALSRKIDVNAEALRGDIRTVLDAVGSLADEMRRTNDSMRQEHAADRAVLSLTLQQHAKRIHELEGK